MKPLNPYNYLISIFVSIGLISSFSRMDAANDLMMFNVAVASGIDLMAIGLIGGILYLGYFARSKYDERQKARNEKP